MAARKFKFVSPGVFLKEVDNSQLPKLPGPIGPIIIGRTRKGPAMKPVQVSSYADFVEIFGEPVPGGRGDDVWREGNGLLAPAYAHYAAKAYFSADIQSPVTMVRLLGVTGDNAVDGGEAGWTSHGTWGLFVMKSGSNSNAFNEVKLAGLIYGETDFTASLSGTDLTGSTLTGKNDAFFEEGSDGYFTIRLSTSTQASERKISFTPGDKNYIRKVLNTNPVATNNQISYVTSGTLADKYWLGETFEENIPSGELLAFISRIRKDSTVDMGDFSNQMNAAQTGWVFAQDVGAAGSYNPDNQEKLFRIKALHEGETASKELVVAIEDIRIPEDGDLDPYGSFSVVVKRIYGTKLEVVESFTGCNLNPNSQNYVARQVGDQYQVWSSAEKRNKVYGNYPNQSRYIRMEMKSDVDNGMVSPAKIPFGFYGPVVPSKCLITLSDSANNQSAFSGSFINGTVLKIPTSVTTAAAINGEDLTVAWPTIPHVVSASVFGDEPFGVSVFKKDSSGAVTSKMDFGYVDYLRRMPSGLTSLQDTGLSGSNMHHSFVFSLDEVIVKGSGLGSSDTANVTAAFFLSGSRRSSTNKAYTQTGSIQTLLEMGFNKFQMPLAGGCDGVNVTEADPFNNRYMLDKTTANNYAFASVDRAIELIKDPEFVEHNLAVMPGITTEALTLKLVEKCEARADSMAIIDLPSVYKPAHELKCESFQDRIATTPQAAASALKARQINSSYGAAYYPWVKIRDTENTADVWVPPSVVALGIMAYTEEREEVWFAPAGFNRGGLNEGNAGLPVLQVSEQLLSKQRDALYAANINPIASFVTEGIVVFGQKTLQTTQSALDRINVRRLLIFIKKEVSRIANGLLFDQNVPATWNRFLGQVNPFLQSVQTRLGLSDYKVILDETTTTPDLIDRNVMYAKIFLKPARAIEFIAVDFVITNTGASFED